MVTLETLQARRAALVDQHAQTVKAIEDHSKGLQQIVGAILLCDEMIAGFGKEEAPAAAAVAEPETPAAPVAEAVAEAPAQAEAPAA